MLGLLKLFFLFEICNGRENVTCDTDFEAFDYGGTKRCIKLLASTFNQDDAFLEQGQSKSNLSCLASKNYPEKECKKLNATLPLVRNQAENEALTKKVQDMGLLGGNFVWLGIEKFLHCDPKIMVEIETGFRKGFYKKTFH